MEALNDAVWQEIGRGEEKKKEKKKKASEMKNLRWIKWYSMRDKTRWA